MQFEESRPDPTEGLLREAAEWEPDQAAPEGLAARALAGELKRQERPEREPVRVRRGVAVLLGGLFGGGAVSAALASTLWAVMVPGPATRPAGVSAASQRSAQVAGDVAAAGAEKPRILCVATRTPNAEQVARIGRTGHPQRPTPNAQHRRRAYRLVAKRPATKPTPPPLPQAEWITEEVEHHSAGVLTPVVLLRTDPETGALVARPGVVDIPLPAPESACEPTSPLVPESPAGAPVETEVSKENE